MVLVPELWPPDVTYIRENRYSEAVRHLTDASLKSFCPADLEDQVILEDILPKSRFTGPFKSVSIQRVLDKAHPAYGQLALHANEKLAPNSFVIDYLGYVHLERESDLSSDYDLRFGVPKPQNSDSDSRPTDCHAFEQLGIDAARYGNEARCINDYRSVPRLAPRQSPGRGKDPKGPNCEFRERLARSKTGTLEMRMSVFTVRGERGRVQKGEELLVSYGKGFWEARRSA